ncbi:Uncharacterised protein [Bordetella pertussis]|nr:Uncharacterised protein [Bordetella pertussis]
MCSSISMTSARMRAWRRRAIQARRRARHPDAGSAPAHSVQGDRMTGEQVVSAMGISVYRSRCSGYASKDPLKIELFRP